MFSYVSGSKSKVLWNGLFFILILYIVSCSHKQRSFVSENTYYAAVVDTILHKSGKKFRIQKSKGMSFYYEPDKYFNSVIQTLITDADRSKKQCMKMLGLTTLPYEMKVIYFNDREKIRPYLNMAPKGIALPDAYTLLIATNDSIRAYHTHEMMHIVSINHFGAYAAAPADWIQEGMSVYTDNPCLGYSIHEIAAYLLYAGKIPPLDSLFNQFRKLPDVAAYMTAGSLVWYLRDIYGAEKFKNLWISGVGKLSEIYHRSNSDIENDYHDYLRKKYPAPPSVNWELVHDKGCG